MLCQECFPPRSHLDFEVAIPPPTGQKVSTKAIHGEQDDHFFSVVVANALAPPRTSFLGLSTSPVVFGHKVFLVHLESGMR